MTRQLTDGERDILRELAADAEGWTDESAADDLHSEASILAELRADLDAARDNERRLREHEAARIAAMLATEATQAAVSDQPPF
ncbi:MAG: hypothetical protein M3Q29_01945 [Chloroflexota bacterium]|nr:hypothetical protein [Chloroflexota bacterium]